MAESYGVITERHTGYIISLFITYGYGVVLVQYILNIELHGEHVLIAKHLIVLHHHVDGAQLVLRGFASIVYNGR